MSKVIYDKFWYHDTTLVDKSGKVTLLGHRYVIRSGKTVTLTNKIEAFEFDDSQSMVETILRKRHRKLPDEADGQPQYVPKRLLTLKNKYQEQL